MADTLKDLEVELRELSHDTNPLKLIQDFAESLGKTANRQRIFNKRGALVQKPILYQDVLEKGLLDSTDFSDLPSVDPFVLLQGDIVSTNTAYLRGERLEGMKFAIASSTCDLVPNRREYAALLRLEPIIADYPNAKELISNLLKFKSTQRMYLPPLPEDGEEVIANAVIFDGIVQIYLNDLLMAKRDASLSLVGWRIFGSLVRIIMVRAGESEIKMRTNLSLE